MDEWIKKGRRFFRSLRGDQPAAQLGAGHVSLTSEWQDIEARVNEYVDFAFPPGFALMIDGPWGSGKTHFLDEFVKRRKKRNPDFVCAYISLYGLQSAADINRALLGAIYPIFKNKGVDVGRRLFTGLVGQFGIKSDVGIQDIIGSKADLFVFDDLERCDMPLNVALGCINGFVEHAKQKVILVANQKEIPDEPKYVRIREKLIGQTIHLSQDLPAAFADFLSKVATQEARDYLSFMAEDVLDVYQMSKLKNLRLLRQSIWDFEKYFRHVPAGHLEDSESMAAVTRFFFAVSLELRAGNIEEKDLTTRQGWDAYFRRNGEERSRLDLAQDRYPTVNLGDMRLPVEPMLDLILRGRIGEDIANSLRQCTLFLEAPKESSWRTVWSTLEREEEDVRDAVVSLAQEFADRQYTSVDEMRHVFGVWLWLARQGISDRTLEQAIEDCKAYVADVAAKGLLDEESPQSHRSPLDGASGFGFMGADTPEFQTVSREISEAQEKLFTSRLADKAQALLALLAVDNEAFLRQLVFVQGSESCPYATVPILRYLNPEKFLDTVFARPASTHHSTLLVLKMRYENLVPTSPLRDEVPWVSGVAESLRRRIAKADPIRAYRLGMFLNHYVLPQLNYLTGQHGAEA